MAEMRGDVRDATAAGVGQGRKVGGHMQGVACLPLPRGAAAGTTRLERQQLGACRQARRRAQRVWEHNACVQPTSSAVLAGAGK